jgi:tetratricopeptide (TPR) repeat protein
MSAPGNESEIDQQLRDLQEKAGELIPLCRFASSSRLYGELRRRGRTEHRAHAYVMGTFFQMDQAQYLLDFQTMRERAVELIALLEDEEQLRQIQSDFPRDQYEYLVYSMSSCAYENLAEATGQLEGYNSEGMHACIADGIQICRRTGKTGCVSCFREYACDVYLAADDPDIAGHQCRLVMEQESGWSDRGDRRWLASTKLAWLEAMQGRFDEALATIDKALEFTDGEAVSLKYEGRIRTLLVRDSIRLAAGLEPLLPTDAAFAEMPSAEECPVFENAMDLNTALQLVREQQWEEASQLLTKWDQRLQKCNGTHLWFETRLRLIALKRLAGQQKQAEALAKQLEQRARTANDYLTLRRLEHLMDSDEPSPLAIAAPIRRNSKDTAITGSSATADDISATAAAANDIGESEETPAESPSPLASTIAELRERMTDLMQDPSDEKFDALRADVLALDSTLVSHKDDTAGVLHLMGYLVGSGDDGEEVWKWANALAASHRENSVVLSLLGTLGDELRNSGNTAMAEKITPERTEQLFRKSMELDPTKARNFLRAGNHFANQDNNGEAERCFARAFRLDRTDGNIVRRLADLYNNTDRPRDALNVLDVCLREGSDDAQVAFDAAMLAFRLKQYDATLTYLEKFEQLAGENLWTNYYRGVCYYEQGEYTKALESLDREEKLAEATGWHLELMRAISRIRLGDVTGAQPHLDVAMETPFSEIDFLSSTGLMELMQRLAVVADEVMKDQALVARIEARLLRSGLMPEVWFQWHRESGDAKPVENVRLYRCLIHQPLDETWDTDPDRLSDQQGWTQYVTEWAILAQSEDEARETALKYQAMCCSLEATVQEVLESEESYTDATGPVWQGARYPVGDDEDDLGEFSEDENDSEEDF